MKSVFNYSKMNEEETKEWMKEHYSDLDDFDNLQFVKDCAEDGVKEYKKKVKEIINRNLKCDCSNFDNNQPKCAMCVIKKELELEL